MATVKYFHCHFLCQTTLVPLRRTTNGLPEGVACRAHLCAGVPCPASGANRSADFAGSCGLLTLRQRQPVEVGRGTSDSCFDQTPFALLVLDRPGSLDH